MVYGISIESILSRKWSLTKKNIDDETNILTSILPYFTLWIRDFDESTIIDPVSTRDWDVSYFISMNTYHSLLTLVRGVLGYA